MQHLIYEIVLRENVSICWWFPWLHPILNKGGNKWEFNYSYFKYSATSFTQMAWRILKTCLGS